jgi:endogenous inhibitor of DNA gyrase (YacG/DUF329 family)
MDHSEYKSKTVAVHGDKYAKEKNVIPAYTRLLYTRPVTFTCTVCGDTVTQERFPSHKLLYCSDECQDQGTKAKKRERERIRRAKKREQEQTKQERVSSNEK